MCTLAVCCDIYLLIMVQLMWHVGLCSTLQDKRGAAKNTTVLSKEGKKLSSQKFMISDLFLHHKKILQCFEESSYSAYHWVDINITTWSYSWSVERWWKWYFYGLLGCCIDWESLTLVSISIFWILTALKYRQYIS